MPLEKHGEFRIQNHPTDTAVSYKVGIAHEYLKCPLHWLWAMPRSSLRRETPSGMPMANATAIAVSAAPPEEARHATLLAEPALCAYASCLRRVSLRRHWSHRLQDFSPPYDLWSNHRISALESGGLELQFSTQSHRTHTLVLTAEL
ncbi:hypothetical protein [Scytonema sp. HK-05]|uniref:hypothetical protein n=1 Tax=Scytonema sp. HK-05 TaxID=1137095 RepID=UPI001300FF52|nr:hypothetical protein [Scytonema sp. HK-05]